MTSSLPFLPADRPPFGGELRQRLGVPRHARVLDSSPRSRVWYAELSGMPVVVKQLVGDGPQPAERYAREVAALRLAVRVEPPVVPRLLGTDPSQRLLVLEHLTHSGTLADDWVVAYAEALARLHAAPAGGPIPAGGPVPVGSLPAWSGPTAADADSFLALAGTFGCRVPAGVRDELLSLVGRLAELPGDALLHGDPCPGNDLHSPAGIRFIDFEQASLGSGVVELAYLRIGFPTCWGATAVPQPLLYAAESAYRTAWRAATGAELAGDLTDACAGWLIQGDALVERARRGTADHLARLPHHDWAWGPATARQRLAHRLGVVARSASADGPLARLAVLSADLRARLFARWPDLQPLPVRRP